jgi:hypothetical protein
MASSRSKSSKHLENLEALSLGAAVKVDQSNLSLPGLQEAGFAKNRLAAPIHLHVGTE